MREEATTYELIERYLDGDLKGSELEAFEKELQFDAGLQRQVKLHRMANELVIENRLLQVKEILQDQKNIGGNKNWRTISFAAAGVLLLSSLIFFLKEDKKTISSEKTAVKTSEKKNENQVAKIESDKTSEGKKISKPEISEKVVVTTETTNKIVESFEKNTPVENRIVENEPTTINEDKTAIENNKPEEKTTVTTTPVDNCESVTITADVNSNPSCTGEDNGSILITNIKGGHGPYKLYLYDSNKELRTAHLKLASGNYFAEIKDSKGCVKKLNDLKVAEKNCPKDYSFNPFMGETWNIPPSSQKGRLYIYDNRGNIYHEQEIAAGAEEQWSGQSKDGELNTGYYLFVLKYQDGKQVQGSVTIVR